ncbi:unnamed protein product [Hydatigera taeniaeformis]|uniref:PDEase domain-containing protein n=1 Tax=Hydatigena taeniaeformis TaxID=6205 RepID=A0A0R3X0D6_HYDTA|nr:unnamed protein product [Hydatigera taeniaeformis]
MERRGMEAVFSDLECLSIIIACLSHDLDHRGTNNQFQIRTMSPLVNLYSTSVLEHHHFDQCIMLLSTKWGSVGWMCEEGEGECEKTDDGKWDWQEEEEKEEEEG